MGSQSEWSFLRHFAIVGACSGLNGVCIVFSNPHVAGITQSLLGNTTLVFTVALAVLYLNQKLSPLHWVGVVLVLGGALCEVLPKGGDATQAAATAAEASFSVFWTTLFALAQLPQAFSSIYQEQVFADNEGVNVFLFLTMSSLFQFVFLLLCAPLNLVPGLGSASDWTDLAQTQFVDAGLCLANANATLRPQCVTAAADISSCVATMLMTNLFQMLLVKTASATVVAVVVTLVTPVSAFAFTMPWLMGADHVEPLSWTSALALCVMLAGISCCECWRRCP